MDEAQVERRLAAILVADIAGYSRLMAEDEAALKGHQAVVLPLVAAHTPELPSASAGRRQAGRYSDRSPASLGLRCRAGAIGQGLPPVLRHFQQGVALSHKVFGGGHRGDLDGTL